MASLKAIEALINLQRERIQRLRKAGDYAGADQASQSLNSLYAQRALLWQKAA